VPLSPPFRFRSAKCGSAAQGQKNSRAEIRFPRWSFASEFYRISRELRCCYRRSNLRALPNMRHVSILI
jgi:hypothetical protein